MRKIILFTICAAMVPFMILGLVAGLIFNSLVNGFRAPEDLSVWLNE